MKSRQSLRFEVRDRTWLTVLVCFCLGVEGRAGAPSFPEFKVESARAYLETVGRTVQAPVADQAELCFMQARLQSQLGQQDQAERLAGQALAHDPNRAEVWVFQGDLLIRQDRLEEARVCLQKAVKLEPAFQGGYRRLGMVLDRLGDIKGAREALSRAVESAADDASARLLLGRFLLAQGEAREAAVHLKKACELEPDSANAFYALAQTQTALGERESAQKTFAVFQKLKREEKTAADAKNAARDNDEEMRAVVSGYHIELAAFYLQRRRTDLAEEHLRQAVSIAPNETMGHESLAAFYLQTGRISEAKPPCETLATLRPDDVTYRVNLGSVLLQLGDHAAAVAHLQRALALDPNQTEALHNLTRFYLGRRQNVGEALGLCRRLTDLQPTAANFDLLAWAFYANGQSANARAASARSVEKEPENATYRERYRRLQQVP